MEATIRKASANKSTQLLAVSIGHFINDFYVMLLPPILFIFAKSMALTMTQQAFIVALITSSSSFLQPIIGYFVDTKGKPWLLTISVIWIAFWMTISGLVKNYYLLTLVITLGAFASALYHPLGSSMVVSLGSNSKGKSLAIFMTIGGLAASLSPIVGIPLVENFGLQALPYLMIPGFMVAGFMYISKIHEVEFKPQSIEKQRQRTKLDFYTGKWLSILVFIATVRITIMSIIMSFGVQLLLLKNINTKAASIILFMYFVLTSVSTLLGGYMSDAIGNKKVFVLSNLLLIISLLFLIKTTGITAVIGLMLIAFSANLANSSNIVLTQELLPHNVSLATGLIMGLAGGLAGIGILTYGRLADSFGLLSATTLCLAPLILITFLTIILPHDKLKHEKINVNA